MSKLEKLSLKIIHKGTNYEIVNPNIIKLLCEYIRGKTELSVLEQEVDKEIFYQRIIKYDIEFPEDFYQQNKKEIDKDNSKKAIFINAFNILDFNKFKRSLKETYPDKFYDPNFRSKIFEEQNGKCAICKTNLDGKLAHLHHINYNKQDCNKSNLVFLCPRCHGKTNKEREFWQGILQEYKVNDEIFTSDT
jgi:hypothetical protein